MAQEQARRRERNADKRLAELRRGAAVTPLRVTDALILRQTVIVGATGSGKTNNALYLVARSDPSSCLIIDVKQEYRKLKEILRREVRVIAVGEEPRLRYNPLIPLEGLDYTFWDRAFVDVFIRSYGLSEPSRRILLDCLWELREGSKGSPTLRELEGAVGEFKTESAKEQGSKRSLESRLHVINMGTVGRSLNSEKALDFGAMDGKVAVYEIGQVGSLRDQRFLAELMLAQLWHFDTARSAEAGDRLQRLIVVEEAHRYLSEERPPQQRGDRTLLELAIAEARKCGWGFLIVDQMPTLLSRYVWENCGTVISHRLTNLDSYEVVRSALGGGVFTTDTDVAGDPTALRLPEDLAMFRRYVDPDSVTAGTGFVMVPRVERASEHDGMQNKGATGNEELR